MSLIHHNSCECNVSPLEWFHVAPTQTAVEKTYDVEYQPLTAIRDNAPIEFYVPASTEEYLDLNHSHLHVTCSIVNKDGTACADDVAVAPINDVFNGLWSNVELFMNDRLISHSNNTHGYTSIISHLIHDSEESLNSERAMRLVFKDTPGSMDTTSAKLSNVDHTISGFHINVNGEVLAEGAGNNGLYNRFLYTRGSREFTVIGGLRVDMFEQPRYLPSGISLKLRFHRQKDNYVLMAEQANYKIKIKEAFMTIRKVRTSPGVQLGHADALMKTNAKFPITRKESKILAIASGFSTFVKDNIFLGQLPKRVVIGMVTNDAFSGSIKQNPYHFKDFGINFMQLYTDGEPVLAKPMKINVAEGKYLDAFQSLYKSFDKLSGEKSSIIKREDWPRGYALFAFDLTPDFDGDDHYPLIKHGNLRLEMNFGAALQNTVNVIVYAEFDNIVEISANRSIQFDYQS